MLRFKHKGSRGSIIVDAACSLPIFIIAMGIILMLIAQAGIEDTVSYAMAKASDDVIVTLAGTDAVFPCGQEAEDDVAPQETNSAADKAAATAAFSLGLRSTLSSEWSGDTPRVRLAWLDCGMEYCLSGGINVDNLVSANVGIGTSIPFTASFLDTQYTGRDILFRKWVGESEQDGEYDDTRVYIFPKRGERYHCANCSCLKNGEIQMVLTDKIRRQYAACTTCHAGTLPNGAAIFLMSAGSGTFHRKSCPCITKAYECVALTDAKSMGYSACSLCGGTAEHYNPDSDYFK